MKTFFVTDVNVMIHRMAMEDEGREPSMVNFQKLGYCSEQKSHLILKQWACIVLHSAVVMYQSYHIITSIHFTIILLKINNRGFKNTIIHWILDGRQVKCAHFCWTLSSQVWRCQLQPALQLLCVVLLHVLHECSCVCMFLLHRWFIKIWECWPSRSLSTQLSAVFSSQ